MLGEKIKNLRQAKGMNQTEFAKAMFVTSGAVSQWEKGLTRPDTDRLMQIAKLFSVPLDYFSDDSNISVINGFVPIRRNAVPVIGEIACGEPITADENIQGYADLPDGVRADFALRCNGDSMTPTFNNGDLVLIRAQTDVLDGQIAVVLHDREATLKRVYHRPDSLLLVADNPSFAPITVSLTDGEYTAIQGMAVGYTRLFYEKE